LDYNRNAEKKSMTKPKSKKLLLMLAILLLTPLAAWQITSAENRIVTSKASPNREIYLYQGADRDQQLLAKAKKEGAVTLYTTLTAQDARVLTAAFEKQYGIKVEVWRSGTEKIIQRVLAEAKSGHYEVDVLDLSIMEILYREKILEQFYSPAFKDLVPQAFPKHKYYVADRFLFFVMAYNTNLVKPEDVPNSYADLLHPRWTGKIGIEAADVDWFAAIVKSMGEEQGLTYFKQLAAMKPQMHTNHILVAELVAMGEIPLVPNAFNNNVETLKQKGAPIEWKVLQPAFSSPSSLGLAKNARHPHAALLFADFILSQQGQQILKDLNRVPASLAVDSPLNKFKYQVINPAIWDEWDKWEKLWSDLFLKGEAVKKGGG